MPDKTAILQEIASILGCSRTEIATCLDMATMTRKKLECLRDLLERCKEDDKQ